MSETPGDLQTRAGRLSYDGIAPGGMQFDVLAACLAVLDDKRIVVPVKRPRAARAVFGFALIYNVGAIGAALAGWMNPLVAAIIMPLSSLVSIGLVLGVMRRGHM